MANALLRKSETAKIERIEQLESLVRDMWHEMATCPDNATSPYMNCNICSQICNLGIEMGEFVQCRDCMYLEVMPRRCMVCSHWDRCEKKPAAEANGDCTICNGWVDDGRGGTCIFTDDFWTPHCPYDKEVKL